MHNICDSLQQYSVDASLPSSSIGTSIWFSSSCTHGFFSRTCPLVSTKFIAVQLQNSIIIQPFFFYPNQFQTNGISHQNYSAMWSPLVTDFMEWFFGRTATDTDKNIQPFLIFMGVLKCSWSPTLSRWVKSIWNGGKWAQSLKFLNLTPSTGSTTIKTAYAGRIGLLCSNDRFKGFSKSRRKFREPH